MNLVFALFAEEPGETDANSEAPPVEPLDLPSIESLDEDSDFSVFMQQGVPDDLRQLALRKLWRICPDEIDGLDDYDEDYSIVKMVLEKASDVDKVAKDMPGERLILMDQSGKFAQISVGICGQFHDLTRDPGKDRKLQIAYFHAFTHGIRTILRGGEVIAHSLDDVLRIVLVYRHCSVRLGKTSSEPRKRHASSPRPTCLTSVPWASQPTL